MDLPIPPYQFEKLKSNITYGELQGMPFEEVSVWVVMLLTQTDDKIYCMASRAYITVDKQNTKAHFCFADCAP